MSGRLRSALERNFRRFIEARLPLQRQVTLDQSRIFIVPTRQGMLLLLVAALVLIMAINFESALNYALAFWLISMLWVAVHLTYRNLSGLTVTEAGGTLTRVGEFAEVRLQLSADKKYNRGSVELIHEDWGTLLVDLHTTPVTVSIPVVARQRGPLTLPRFRLESRFPFNLVVAWSQLRIDSRAWAYPEPVQHNRHLAGAGADDEQDATDDHFFRAGSEDFHSLKAYAPGDPIHRLHWPGFSRDQLLVKSFTDYQAADECIAWEQFPGISDEQRLAAIAHFSEHYFHAQQPYSVRLPGQEIAVGKGREHLFLVRRALAEYGYEHG